jgi:hypothetical protein
MESSAPTGDRPQEQRRGFRLTTRVFWDLAIYMVSLGLVVGVIFPPFATLLGVPESYGAARGSASRASAPASWSAR